MAVQARPMTTPGGVSSYNRSEVNIGLPTKSVRLSGFTSNVSLSLLTILYAAFLNTWKGKYDDVQSEGSITDSHMIVYKTQLRR